MPPGGLVSRTDETADSARAAEARGVPFASSTEQLLAELARIDLLVRMHAIRARHVVGDDAFRGLVISDDDAFALFERPPGAPHWSTAPVLPELETRLQYMAGDLEHRRRCSRAVGVPLRLDALADEFALDRLDLDILLIGVAAELDSRYERLFGYLHDDVTRRRPSVDLALALLCPSLSLRLAARERLGPRGRLIRASLVRLLPDAAQPHQTLLQQAFKVEDRVFDFLQEIDRPDGRLQHHAQLLTSPPTLDDLVLPALFKERMQALVQGSPVPAIHIQGGAGTGKRTLAGALAAYARRPLLVVNAATLTKIPLDRFELLVQLVVREARLLRAVVYVQRFDALLPEEERDARLLLLRTLDQVGVPTVLGGELSYEPGAEVGQRPLLRVHLPMPNTADRVLLWQRELGADVQVDAHGMPALLARSYRISGGQIRAAMACARGLAQLRSPARPCVTMADLIEGCQHCAQPRLGSLARRVNSTSSWDDLVLSPNRLERLREVAVHARHRGLVMDEWGFERKLPTGRGLSVLFTGPPGTGKTLAASVIANDLGLDLFQIDLSAIVSKYIGETEKQLARVFAEAEGSSAVLFFDEADALFGKRSETHDARDRYANMEVAYLLQRMDSYEGVVVLATNLGRNMDEAFTRRLRFIVDFALPDEAERRRIWEQILPPAVPKAADIDISVLAKRFELAGGQIRNIALAATFLAAEDGRPLNQRHLLHAARREYQKMGKIMDEAVFLSGR